MVGAGGGVCVEWGASVSGLWLTDQFKRSRLFLKKHVNLKVPLKEGVN